MTDLGIDPMALLQTNLDAVVAADECGVVAFWSRQAEVMFGWAESEALGRSMTDLMIPPRFREPHRRGLAEVSEGDSETPINRRYRLAAVDKLGMEFPVEISIARLPKGAGAAFVGRIRDLSADLPDRVDNDEAANARLRMLLRGELLARALKAQEEERTRVARDLHDQLGQTLSSIRMGLSMLEHEVHDGADPDHVARELRHLGEQALGSLDEVRAIAHNLRPALLDDVGLEAAVERHAEQWSLHSNVSISLHVNGVDKHLHADLRTAIYRVLQESLNNIARHAGATSASILLRQANGVLRLVVEDDGVGFDPPTEANPSIGDGIGLQGMAERMALVEGVLVVESAPGRGTTIMAEAPV
ncbi:MAG: PAS domain-containing sensor histidine kinase [Candidatus Dormibacteria bacterium]